MVGPTHLKSQQRGVGPDREGDWESLHLPRHRGPELVIFKWACFMGIVLKAINTISFYKHRLIIK